MTDVGVLLGGLWLLEGALTTQMKKFHIIYTLMYCRFFVLGR